VSSWIKRFGLHLAAAIGATGIFVAAAAVGANQTRMGQEQVASVTGPGASATVAPERTPGAVVNPRRPTATPAPSGSEPAATPALGPERSVAGSIREVQPDGVLVVQAVGGRLWRVFPSQGALIRLNGKAAPLDALHAGDNLVILGQPEQGPGNRILAHAITARRK
jgi:hypothetical protein